MPICYLDRDGVINHHLPYVGTKDRFIWHDEIIDILKDLKKLNYEFIIVTNQSGISRGYYSLSQFFILSYDLINKLNTNGINIEIRFCPHLPNEKCHCRKPNSGMVSKDKRSNMDIFIGDQKTDMECAFSSGVKHRWLINSDLDCDIATRTAKNHKELKKYLFEWYKNDIIKDI